MVATMQFLFLLLPSIAFAQYLPFASIAWRRQLQGRMRRGNGMAFAKQTGLLVATTDNGAMHILKGEAIFMYSPTEIIQGTLLCNSKPVLASPEIAIYAVSNYVLAVNITNASTIWFTPVEEPIMGSPAVSRRGQSVYVTHNAGNTGYISILRLSTGERLAALSGGVPFGPPTVVFRTTTSSDVVMFGDATDTGYSTKFANLYALVWSRQHANRNGRGENSYELIVAASGIRTTGTAPAVENDLRVYLGSQGSMVFGFDHNAQNNILNERVPATPWTVLLDLDPTNALTPIPTTPVVSSDSLFVAAAGSHISSISLTGVFAGWQDRSIGSPVFAQPIYYNDPMSFPVLYFVELDGIVYQKDARFGTTYWQLDVEFPVEADMAMSDTGNLLYVGDTSGNLLAIKVATNPTLAPTDAPTTQVPTIAPAVPQTEAPTIPEMNLPVVSAVPVAVAPPVAESTPVAMETITPQVAPQMAPQQQPSSSSSVVQDASRSSQNAKEENFLASNMYLLAIGGILVLLALLCLCFMRRRRHRKQEDQTKSAEATAVEERIDDEELQAYEMECAENERMTLQDIAESPVKADRSRSISSWDTGIGTPHTLTSIEESPEVDEGSKTVDDKSVGYEVAMDRSVSEHMSTARSLDGIMSEVDDASASHGEARKTTGMAAALAESTEALAQAVGAAVAAIYSSEEKKEADSVASKGAHPLRRVKSSETDLSTPTQPGRIRSDKNRPSSPSDMISVDSSSIYLDEPSIQSMELAAAKNAALEDAVAKNSAVEDAVVGKAEPAPKDCPEDEGRGILRPGSAYLSRHNEKKVEQPPEFDAGIRTRSAPGPNRHDRLQPMYNGVSVRPAGRSRAGIFSRRQPQLTTFTDDEEETQPSTQLPVKLGPKRSEIIRSQRPEPDEGEGQPRFTAHGYYEEPQEITNIVSLDSDDQPDPVKVGPARRSSKSKKRNSKSAPPDDAANTSTLSTLSDPWGSFLSELSKVETSFFSTSGLLAGRNGEDSGDDATADEDKSAPPPAPRTFYA